MTVVNMCIQSHSQSAFKSSWATIRQLCQNNKSNTKPVQHYSLSLLSLQVKTHIVFLIPAFRDCHLKVTGFFLHTSKQQPKMACFTYHGYQPLHSTTCIHTHMYEHTHTHSYTHTHTHTHTHGTHKEKKHTTTTVTKTESQLTATDSVSSSSPLLQDSQESPSDLVSIASPSSSPSSSSPSSSSSCSIDKWLMTAGQQTASVHCLLSTAASGLTDADTREFHCVCLCARLLAPLQGSRGEIQRIIPCLWFFIFQVEIGWHHPCKARISPVATKQVEPTVNKCSPTSCFTACFSDGFTHYAWTAVSPLWLRVCHLHFWQNVFHVL